MRGGLRLRVRGEGRVRTGCNYGVCVFYLCYATACGLVDEVSGRWVFSGVKASDGIDITWKRSIRSCTSLIISVVTMFRNAVTYPPTLIV